MREELRVVYDAIDELRESVDQVTRGYRQDDWQPVQPRPIVSMALDPTDPEFGRKLNAFDPAQLPADLPDHVRSAVAARLRESQGPGGMDSLADAHRPSDTNGTASPVVAATQQRSFWEAATATEANGSVSIAAEAADAVPAKVTSQKEAEPAGSATLRSTGVELSDPTAVEPEADAAERPVAPLPGHELVALMQRHKVTIGELAKRTGITQKRIRQAREQGLSDPNAVRDWVQAIRGRDSGPVGEVAAGGSYTLDDWLKFRERCLDGDTAAAVLKDEFVRMKAGKQHFIEALLNTKSADQLRLMAMQRGILDARRHTKPENAAALYRGCLSSFTLGDSVSYQPMQESYEEAVERIVLAITDEQIAAERERVRKRQDEKAKALSNPETLLEFATFSRERGLDQLTDDQFARWDALHADRVREERRSHKKRETVEQFQSEEIADLGFRIIEGRHDPRRRAAVDRAAVDPRGARHV